MTAHPSKTCGAPPSAAAPATSQPRPPRGAVAPLGRGAGRAPRASRPRPRVTPLAVLATVALPLALAVAVLPALVLIDAINRQGARA